MGSEKPLGVYSLGPRSSSCGPTKGTPPLYGPSEVNTPQVDGLSRIPGLTQDSYKSHPQPPSSVLRSPTSDPPKRQHSRQFRASSVNTQGNQGEKEGEGATHEHYLPFFLSLLGFEDPT